MVDTTRRIPLRDAGAAALSLLVFFVGVVHEVVGSTLYPKGPNEFGGPIGWHGAGIGLVFLGSALLSSTLGFTSFPIRIPAAAISLAGLFITVQEFIQNGKFHLFAATLLVCGGGIAFLHQPRSRKGSSGTPPNERPKPTGHS
jgi:hypothetical protein